MPEDIKTSGTVRKRILCLLLQNSDTVTIALYHSNEHWSIRIFSLTLMRGQCDIHVLVGLHFCVNT